MAYSAAKARNQGTEEIRLFKKWKAYSEIYSFKLCHGLRLPEGISHGSKSSTITNIFLEDSPIGMFLNIPFLSQKISGRMSGL